MKKRHLVVGSLLLMSMLSGCKDNRIQVGILQPVDHKALTATRLGFMEGLNEKGYGKDKVHFIYENARGKEAELNNKSKSLVANSDLTLGLGTDAAKALASSALDKGSTKPILFSAVTDPVGAGLVDSLDVGSGYITGMSDDNPVEAQIELILECFEGTEKEVDKIGLLYTRSEENSVAQANRAKKVIEEHGINAITKTATGDADVSSTAVALVNEEGLDAIYIPTDNNIAAKAGEVKDAVSGKGILVVTGEKDMLVNCGAVTLSIDYFELGKRTGYMAAAILSGEKEPKDIPVGYMALEECEYYYSSSNCTDAGITLPSSVISKSKDVSE